MARPKKCSSMTMDEMITKQEEAVTKARVKYDEEVKKLKDLHAKKDEEKKKLILEAAKNSTRSMDEILAFLEGKEE